MKFYRVNHITNESYCWSPSFPLQLMRLATTHSSIIMRRHEVHVFPLPYRQDKIIKV